MEVLPVLMSANSFLRALEGGLQVAFLILLCSFFVYSFSFSLSLFLISLALSLSLCHSVFTILDSKETEEDTDEDTDTEEDEAERLMDPGGLFVQQEGEGVKSSRLVNLQTSREFNEHSTQVSPFSEASSGEITSTPCKIQ